MTEGRGRDEARAGEEPRPANGRADAEGAHRAPDDAGLAAGRPEPPGPSGASAREPSSHGADSASDDPGGASGHPAGPFAAGRRSGLVLRGFGAAPGVAVGRVLHVDESAFGDGSRYELGLGGAESTDPDAGADGAAGLAQGTGSDQAEGTGRGRGQDTGRGMGTDQGAGPVHGPSPSSPGGSGSRAAGGHAVLDALAAVAAELARLADVLRSEGRGEQGDIVEVGALIAGDPALGASAAELAGAGMAPEEAVVAAANRHADALTALGDPVFADRATDVRQIGRRAAAWLRGASRPVAGAADAVVVGEELAAADVLMPGRGPVAVVSARGGPTGHLAVVARALGVPLVLGVDVEELRGADGRRVLVDGDRGLVVLDPVVRDLVPDFSVTREGDVDNAVRPVHTRDGFRVRVAANVGGYREAVAARARGAEGIGLLRTELPFLTADHWPDAEEHAAALVPLLRDGPEGTVVVRTLDFAGDKRPWFAAGPGAARSDAILRTQFRGILAAAATTARSVRILVPMVEDATEFARCRHVLAEVCRSLGAAHPGLGAMVELPGAVRDAEALAACADFLALGTNDLTAAVLGLARHDPALTPDRAAEPAVLRALRHVVDRGHAFQRTVSVCGDAAADPRVLPLLVGLGVDVLSVAPPALEPVRQQVRTLDAGRCAELVRERLAPHG